MECPGTVVLVLMTLVSMTCSMPAETTSRSSPFRETQKVIKNDFLGVNPTSSNVLDVRTPPKILQQVQNKLKQKEEIENSHAGIAIPVDENIVKLEETTKKLNFYKIERPTTNSGLSTWILLSGQSSTTSTKSPPKNTPPSHNYGEKSKQNFTTMFKKPERIVKPIFRKRTPATTEKTSTKTSSVATTPLYEVSKLTKVKASELNMALNKKNNTSSVLKKPTTISNLTKNPTTTISPGKFVSATDVSRNITGTIADVGDLKNSTSLSSSALSAEAKEGDADLSNTDDTKKKKNSTKRKKNKNRRRKPTEKNGNITSISKPTKVKKEKPIGTQLYNYLSREIMPTVGVGLVGLMVTAGLASYFLYPFGIARRSYEVDRKDKEGNYYYNNDYTNGMPEEEAIGKVIAGMPSDSMATNSYMNTRYRLVDRRAQIQPHSYEGIVQGSVEDVPLTFDRQDKDTYNTNYQTLDYSTNMEDKKFVVGSIPKELVKEVTPVSVPEHGPRNLKVTSHVEGVNEDNMANEKLQESFPELRPAFGPRSLRIRRRRSGISNEIDDLPAIEPLDVTEKKFIQRIEKTITTTDPTITTTDTTITTTEKVSIQSQTTTTELPSTTSEGLPQKFASFLDLMKDLIHVKARLSLQVLQNISQSFSRYISRAQIRLDEHIHNRRKND